jgi:phosphoenolpyruvate---glycerone phosphotransferase subunit DhaL
MKIKMNSKDYLQYMSKAAKAIKEQKDYITQLDAATGDGDHWVNLNMGFEKILEQKEELETISLSEMFRKIAMILMSNVGGSSGVLYGSAYLKASQVVVNEDVIDIELLNKIITAELEGIMRRGNAQPGYKTMVDPLFRACEGMERALQNKATDKNVLLAMKKGAEYGMNETLHMEAVKGRASYQSDKGVGKLDPGAVTMFYQLKSLTDYLLEKINQE